jgi:hypothetical protein
MGKRIDVKASKDSAGVNTRHEAAHAVVSVRLKLPLASVDIRSRRVPDGHRVLTTTGLVAMQEGAVAAWAQALPALDARNRIVEYATQAAAGPVADQGSAIKPDDLGASVDWQQIFEMAVALGIGPTVNDPMVKAWALERTRAAAAILNDDGGAAWDRVRFALARRKSLTGDEVRRLIDESDRQGPQRRCQ